MRELNNAYRVLELEPGASMEEVNQAYKDLVFVWHPDRIPQDNERLYQKAQDKIKALNQARDLLRAHSRQSNTSRTTRQAASGYGSTTRSYATESRYGTSYQSRRYGSTSSSSTGSASNGGAGTASQGNGYSSSQNRYYRPAQPLRQQLLQQR